MPRDARREAADIRVTGMRVDGSSAHLLYEDGDGTQSQISMDREGSKWMVAVVAGAPLSASPGS